MNIWEAALLLLYYMVWYTRCIDPVAAALERGAERERGALLLTSKGTVYKDSSSWLSLAKNGSAQLSSWMILPWEEKLFPFLLLCSVSFSVTMTAFFVEKCKQYLVLVKGGELAWTIQKLLVLVESKYGYMP